MGGARLITIIPSQSLYLTNLLTHTEDQKTYYMTKSRQYIPMHKREPEEQGDQRTAKEEQKERKWVPTSIGRQAFGSTMSWPRHPTDHPDIAKFVR